MTLLTAWLCGAFPIGMLVLSNRPHGVQWLAAIGIVLLWPAFLIYALWPERK